MKRLTCNLAACLLAFSLVACGGQAQQAETADTEEVEVDLSADDDEEFVLPPIPDDVTGGKPWIDSVVVGNVTEATETSPQDDLYLYVNKDWITSTTIPEGRQFTDSDVFAEGRASVIQILTGDALTEHDARQAQLLFDAFCDTDARTAAGVEPARQVIDDIRSLSSIDEVSAFLLDTERSAGVPSLVTVINKRDSSTHRWQTEVRLSTPTFGRTVGTMGMNAANIDPESVFYTTRLALVSNVLTRLGYTEDEAKAAFEGRLELERALLQAADKATDDQDETQPLTIDQLDGLVGSFPVRALAEARGYGQAEGFIVSDAADLQAAAAVYNDEHLDNLRDYLICGYVLDA
ncbi:MAG: hypothetical protein IJ092_07875, partial [Atopobiaceae bacterium]|nr:hypothetical protein [Atopobiaceae bacterium]